MGRKRKGDDPFGLAGTRLAWKHGRFWYRHRATPEQAERWEDVGTDVVEAKRMSRLYLNPGDDFGTVRYWMPLFLQEFRAMVAAKTRSQRTLDDYQEAQEHLLAYFGRMYPERIAPNNVSAYLKMHADAGRPVPANRERAALSSMISWLLRRDDCPPGLTVNPCMRASGVVRNTEATRERYVTDEEYLAVYKVAPRSVQIMMELTYRTLQRPESDIIRWTTAIVKRKGDGRVLHFRQGKTGRLMEIELVGRLETMINHIVGSNDKVLKFKQPIVATLSGELYTYKGLGAMLRRAIKAVREKHKEEGGELAMMASFGFRDLKGKGATDMWLSGTPIEVIQALCGHADKATTEKYIKARYRESITPNLITL